MSKKMKLWTVEELIDKFYPTPEDRARYEASFEKYREENRKMLLEELGAKIRKARQSAGVSQSGLAQKLKTNKANISRLEHGRQNLTAEMIYRIGSVLGRPVRIEI